MKRGNGKPRGLYLCKESYHHYKEIDFAILSERYDLTRFHYRYSPASVAALTRAVTTHDFVFTWFASPMASLAVAAARAVGKPSIIVAGGYDVADYAPLRHGMAHRPVQKYFARFALDHADLVLPVSEFNQGELLRFARPQRYRLVPNAVDLPPVDLHRTRKAQVVTLGAIQGFYSKLKGHQRFIDAARLLPNVHFILAGPFQDHTIDAFRKSAPPNVEFTGLVARESLVKLLAESSAYAQLSYYESFGLAVAEAMWCGCTPIVSRQPALMEVAGDTGHVVDADDPAATARAIDLAMTAPLPNLAAIDRAKGYSRDARRDRLLAALSDVIGA